MNENNGIISGLCSLSHTYLSQHVMGNETDCKEWGINPLSTTPPSLKLAFYRLAFKFYKRSDHLQTCPGAKNHTQIQHDLLY